MSRRNPIIRICLIGLLLALAACAGEVAPVAATCPEVLLVGDASIMKLHAPGEERDTDDVSFMAELGTPLWSCEFLTEQNRTRVAVSFEILVSMGPAAEGSDASFPLFVALENHEGEVIAKRTLDTAVRFPEAAAQIVYTEIVGQEFGYARMSEVRDHTIYIGFQITPEQFAETRDDP